MTQRHTMYRLIWSDRFLTAEDGTLEMGGEGRCLDGFDSEADFERVFPALARVYDFRLGRGELALVRADTGARVRGPWPVRGERKTA